LGDSFNGAKLQSGTQANLNSHSGVIMSNSTKAIVSWVIIGVIAGALASLVVGGGGGLIGWLIAGLIGSVVGGFLARRFNIKPKLGNPFFEQVIVAFVGAIIVLIIARILT
jgi:uncharacterized membrane protein YeaQ/YmgE (transglycosylase-associated protein family)